MKDSLAQTLFIIPLLALLGLVALSLVGNELGKRVGLGVAGRLALGAGLGFGVIAIAIKTFLVFYLHSLRPADIASVRTFRLVGISPPPFVSAEFPPDLRDASFQPWEALPPKAPSPPYNRSTPEKVALGRMLFFDKRLSANNSVSCASCHRLAQGGDDDSRVSTGIKGQRGNRNAPSVWNAAFLSRLFWDGRAASLEQQAKGPLLIRWRWECRRSKQWNARSLPFQLIDWHSKGRSEGLKVLR